MFDIKEQLKSLPDKPGVYIMKDLNDVIIYVGKAISLKRRVRQYFSNSKNLTAKVVKMVEGITSFEYIITDNEVEALVLECNMIKQYKPKYNVLLKDDKHYPYLKITLNEEYPRLLTSRKVIKDGARYFGPYTNQGALNNTLETIKTVFPIRTCSHKISSKTKMRPCLNFHINRCLGPCNGEINKDDYRAIFSDIIDLLNGKFGELINRLKLAMERYSEELNFEKAALIRDKINNITIITEKQKVLSTDLKDRDVIGYAFVEGEVCIEVFFIRGGKLLGKQGFFLDITTIPVEEAFDSFIKQYYLNAAFIPGEILIANDIEDKELVEEMLQKQRGKKVIVTVPKKGEKWDLLKMVISNAENSLKNRRETLQKERSAVDESLSGLKSLLGLDETPNWIEAFDISNIGDDDIVAGMVVFKNGLPFKEGYRKYKIKSVIKQDDYSSMKEVLTRRLKRLQNEGNGQMPDMLFVDGGQNHVRVAIKVLEELQCKVLVFGMLKDDKHRTKALVSESVEYDIKSDRNIWRFIVTIQDEVHRFALSYNKQLRKTRYVKSALDSILGIGPKKKKSLIKFFGSVEKIKKAKLEEIMEAPGIDKKTAVSIYSYFNNGEL